MKFKNTAICALAAMFALAPLSSAYAHGHDHWRGGPLIGLVALGTAVAIGTVAILTAPINAIAAPPPQAYYAPPPGYYAGPPAGYSPPPPYYAQPRIAYDAPPPYYYNQPPAYYAPPPGYYRRYD